MTERTRRILIGIGFGFVVIVGLMLYTDATKLSESIARFDMPVLLQATGLVLVGYLFRAIKWEIYLRQLNIRLGWVESSWVFFSGLVMAISPMKVGEVLKSFLLRRHHAIPVARTAPVVVAERLTDVIALILLVSIGAATTGIGMPVVIGASILALCTILFISSPKLSRWLLSFISRMPLLGRYAHRFEEAYESMLQLIGLKTMLITTALSVIAWGGEGIACWWIVNAFEGASAPLGDIVFIFAFSTLAGALSMLPGGLLATEGSMIGLLTVVFHTMSSETTATAATLLTRFCTLWFAVILGAVALISYQRYRRPGTTQDP